jgi:hypothetical protein
VPRSVERLAVSVHAEEENDERKEGDGPKFAPEVLEAHAFGYGPRAIRGRLREKFSD